MTKSYLKSSLAIAALTALAACDPSQLDVTAGADIDEGGFGNPTMNNVQAHTSGQSPVVSLNNRFSSQVDSMVNFAFNSAQLDSTAQAVLRRQAAWIRQHPNVRLRVYGHTDLVGSSTYNKRLGLQRAQAVVAYLATQGVARSRLEAVASFGETQPLIVTQGRERRNRRTVTQVNGFVTTAANGYGLHGRYANVVYGEYVASASFEK